MTKLIKSLSSLFVLLSFFYLLPQQTQAETVFVKSASGAGINPDDLTTITSLITNAVSEQGAHTPVNKESDAEVVLVPKINKLGQAYVVTLAREKQGVIDFSSSLRAEHIEEMDSIASRLTQAVLNGVSAKIAQVDNVTNHEATSVNLKRPAAESRIFTLGPSAFNHMNTNGIGTHLGLIRNWEANFGNVKVNLVDLDFRGGTLVISAGFGMDYFFSKEDTSPYLGGEFGLGFMTTPSTLPNADATTAFGFLFSVDGGIRFFRTSSVGFDLGGHISWLTTSGIPTVFVASLGFVF